MNRILEEVERGTWTYHREAKMVLMGEGRSFRNEFDCSRARIPTLAAVSPNLETGPSMVSWVHIHIIIPSL